MQFLSTALVSAPLIQDFSLESEDNTPFDLAEQEQIVARLNRVEERIFESRDFAENEAIFVRRQFDQLRTDAGVAGRRSWFQTTIGVLLSVFAAFFDAETAKEIWGFLNSQFAELLRLTSSSR